VKRIEDQSFVERINRRTDTIEETAEQTAQRVTADLERRNQPG
jgi:formiminotetrahydrofolate cyclodeaminase